MRRLRGQDLPERPLSRGAPHADTLLEVGQRSVGEPEQNRSPVQKSIIPTVSLDSPRLTPVSPNGPDRIGEVTGRQCLCRGAGEPAEGAHCTWTLPVTDDGRLSLRMLTRMLKLLL